MEVLKYLNKCEGSPTTRLHELKANYGIKTTYNEKYDLYVLNYCQIDSPKTHPIVRECRSLVLGVENNDFYTVSRSFDRFYNYGEGNAGHDKLDLAEMTAYEKLDGSLIGVFFYRGEWLYRTKSMIMPEEDMKMNAFGNTWKEFIENVLGKDYHMFLNTEMTYILEAVGPHNHIVTRYEEEKAYLLAVRDNATGEYCSQDKLFIYASRGGWEMPRVYHFNNIEKCMDAAKDLLDLEEGYVVYDQFGLPRFKVKNPAYVAAHHIRGESTPTPRQIINLVVTGETDEYLTIFPRDKSIFQPYISAFFRAKRDFYSTWMRVSDIENQKDFALAIKDSPLKVLLFNIRQNNSLTFRMCLDKLTAQGKRTLVEKYLK